MTYKIYELTVSGVGGSVVRAAFPEFEVVDQQPTTVMRGPVPDQMALEETIARIVGLGFELLEVRNLGDQDPPDARPSLPGTDAKTSQ